jgi:hypothetical protein
MPLNEAAVMRRRMTAPPIGYFLERTLVLLLSKLLFILLGF